MKQNIERIRQLIIPILNKYEIQKASIVGSVARGDDSPESDIDIVVEITEPMSLLTFARFKIEIEDVLERKVDLIERSAIKPRLRKHLLEDEISISK